MAIARANGTDLFCTAVALAEENPAFQDAVRNWVRDGRRES
jgi:hypothetical protein